MSLRALAGRLIVRLNLPAMSARLRMPTLAAYLAHLLSRTVDRGSHHTVLCIGRPIFDEDVEELAKYGGTLNYVIVPKGVFISFFKCFVPELLLSHARYHEIKEHDGKKSRYRAFLRAFLTRFARSTRIDAILTANYNYSWQQELAFVARDLGIPFIVLFKEGISPLFVEGVSPQKGYDLVVAKYTNHRFIGTRLLVYNDRIREGFLNVQVNGVTPEIVETVGIPRFDRYFRMQQIGNKVIFFSFNFEDKARHLGLDDEEFGRYLEKTREFHVEVLRLAVARPELTFIIKTKNNLKYLRYVEEIMSQTGHAGLGNVVITNQGNVYDLIRDARAVIGYNSTALLEAYAARRIVMTADFRWGAVRDYFDEYPNLPYYVTDAKDMSAVLSSVATGRSLEHAELHSLLTERIHIPDGQASARVEAAIRRAIEEGERKNFPRDSRQPAPA